jgi:hypothetical protein
LETIKKSNLVLTFAYTYKWSNLKVFVESLENTGANADLVIYGSRLSRNTLKELGNRQIKVIPVFTPLIRLRNIFLLAGWWPYRILLRYSKSVKIKRIISTYVFNLMCARFSHFLDFLKNNYSAYDNVLIADVRDVYFQSNPFNNLLSNKLFSFLEEGIIGENKSNAKWVKDAYGVQELKSLYNNVITCAGVTIGSSELILKYLELMVSELLNVRHMAPVLGVDQAVHNMIFHKKLIPEATLLGNGNSLCMTMGLMSKFDLNDQGMVVVGDEIISILHQYDRFKDLKNKIDSRFKNS